jgi:hypothetical protein
MTQWLKEPLDPLIVRAEVVETEPGGNARLAALSGRIYDARACASGGVQRGRDNG